MGFPKRFRQARPPEYEELTFRVLANPTGVLYNALLTGDASTPERATELGAALSEAFGGDTVEGYGAVFDFSTPEGAIQAVSDESIPIDLRVWIRNAPTDLIAYEREEFLGKNFKASLIPGN